MTIACKCGRKNRTEHQKKKIIAIIRYYSNSMRSQRPLVLIRHHNLNLLILKGNMLMVLVCFFFHFSSDYKSQIVGWLIFPIPLPFWPSCMGPDRIYPRTVPKSIKITLYTLRLKRCFMKYPPTVSKYREREKKEERIRIKQQ